MGAGYAMKAKGNASAEVFIYEDVGESWFGGVSAKQFSDDLKGLGPVQQIDLRINSYGGSVFDGVAIYRQLVDHPAKVVTHIDGVAASIASVIAMAGSEINISEAGFLMIHNASGVAIGDAGCMRDMATLLDTISSTIGDVYVSRTGQSAEAVKAWMDAETWFGASDAIANGFATAKAANMQVAARASAPPVVFNLAKHKFNRPPAVLAGGRPKFDAAAARLGELRAKLQRARAA